VPSTGTTRPALGTASGWAELAFDLTAVGLRLAWLAGTGYVVLLGVGETLHFLGETESSGGDNRCPGG
jgi:hypothetical protein